MFDLNHCVPGTRMRLVSCPRPSEQRSPQQKWYQYRFACMQDSRSGTVCGIDRAELVPDIFDGPLIRQLLESILEPALQGMGAPRR